MTTVLWVLAVLVAFFAGFTSGCLLGPVKHKTTDVAGQLGCLGFVVFAVALAVLGLVAIFN